MKTLLILAFLLQLENIASQKLHNETLTSNFNYTQNSTVSLVSSIGEASPVSDLMIGTNRLTQGYFQYQTKNLSQIINTTNQNLILSVYPNPFVDMINVDLLNSGYGNIEFVIENILGQKVYTQNIYRINKSADIYSLKFNDLASGQYMLRINFLNDANKNISIKLLKK